MGTDWKGYTGKNAADDTMRYIAKGANAPKSGFVLLLIIYAIAAFFTVTTAKSQGSFNVFDMTMPFDALTGVFSAIGNMCLILMVVFYHKAGYIASLCIICLQIPMLLINLFKLHLPTGFAGIFMYIFTIVAISIIYFKNKSITGFQDRIREQAVKDILTGLPNRFACRTVLDELISAQESFTVVAVDITNFKSINDTMGHDFGNKVLQEIANRWTAIATSGETGTSEYVGRLDGDEFTIIIRDAESDEQILKTIERYKAALESKMTIDDCDYYISAYYGYARCPEDSTDMSIIISGSYAAMHEVARLKSGNSIMRFTHDLLRDEKDMEIELKIRNALENDKVYFHLQPQYDITHHLRGFEALARMDDDDGTPISPARFIPVAENAGIIDQIDMRIFKLAVAFLHEAIEKGKVRPNISVNVSVRHLMKNNFITEIRSELEKNNVPAELIEIEITESVMIDSVDKALSRIDELKEMGIKIAIDDFGTGYSSLSYLNKFPADLLKIDKSFIDVMNNDESSKQYVATFIKIGHLMGFDVISEGVEEEAQVETLKEIGCDYIQGFVWGRPLPRDKAMELICT